MNNKENIIIVFTMTVVITSVIFWFFFGQYQNQTQETKEEEGQEQSKLANPASVYCEEQGGVLENIMFENGVKGFCLFDDGSKCGQWDFFRGDCKKGQLKIEILKEGTGELADVGNTVTVHYTGTFEDGTKFDSSLDRGKPFSFKLGQGQVIKGWEQGVLGMKIGEKRKLTLAPDLAYGEMGIPGAIPPNAVLIFEVELLEIQ